MMNARDEGRHAPGQQLGWSEWWQLDFAREDGFGGFVRLALHPNAKVAWFWAYVVTPEHPGPIVVRDHEVTLPRGDALEVRADGLWAESTCETPLEHWTYGLEAFAVRLDSPGDALRGEIGERLPLGFDLEWEVLSPVMASSATRYEQAGIVHGEVLIGRERVELQGHGMRSHGWEAEPWVAPWAAAAFQWGDAFAVSWSDTCYVWRAGDDLELVETIEFPSQFDDEGLPSSALLFLDGEEIDVDIGGVAVVPLEGYTGRATRLVRALCRFSTRNGTESIGWAEWIR